MSIKTKIPILITAMLLLNMIFLLLYYNLYFYQAVADKVEKISGVRITRQSVKENRIVWDLVKFEVLTIFILILCIGLIVYLTYSRPLAKLNSYVKDYKNKSIMTTKRKDEIGQLQNTFAGLAEELSEEKQAQNRIIASISHDIKTPLTSVLGYSENLIKKDLPQDRVKQYLKVIHSKALDIEEIVQDFDLYIEGKLTTQLNKQPCKLSFIKEMLELEYQKELEQQGILFQVNNTIRTDEEINIDLPKVRRVFANLIGNAIKHNPLVKNLKIKITIAKEAGRVEFQVSDNGNGIKEEDLPYIFEPFYTSDKSRTVSGLGLSISKNIIEAHAGNIWVDPCEKEGCCIRFYMSAQ